MFSKLMNNNWTFSTALGNGLLILLISYLVVDIIINRKMNIIQLLGKEFLIIIAIILIFLRSNVSVEF